MIRAVLTRCFTACIIDDPMVETMKQDQEQINNEIFKQLRMEGLVNEDDPVLPALDHCFRRFL